MSDRRSKIRKRQRQRNQRVEWAHRRFRHFSRRMDYWLEAGDIDRAILMEQRALEALEEWRELQPLAALIEFGGRR